MSRVSEELARLYAVVDDLHRALSGFAPGPPVAYVYDPLSYASAGYREYLRRYALQRGASSERVLLVGMNPGPWGMAQTGVPFGAISRVRGFLGIETDVGRPPREHPKKPVEGFSCPREEVSGERVWSWAESAFGTPDAFFRRFFVWNYCPLMFLDEDGRNVTPDRLRAAEHARLVAPCDEALRRAFPLLGCPVVVGVGDWALARIRVALDGSGARLGKILHPSPASPAANRGWAAQATAQLRALGIDVPSP